MTVSLIGYTIPKRKVQAVVLIHCRCLHYIW